mmetsp:Transcript_67200/g.105744  ORF Transcript_67200/g.105744 Transcript_67200/m.105744 type:complete len:519 (+) Transcript_67200:50-1606(+)
MAGQDRGGNEGFSGTPLWKIQQQMAQYRNQVLAASNAVDDGDKDPPEAPNVIVDTMSVGGPADGKNKFVRTVVVKDFHKISSRMKIDLPKTNVFKEKAPVGLYALFDGQSCAGEPGVQAAEFCARNFHTKVLENLSNLPPDRASEAFVKAALIKSFEDLDTDLLKAQPEVQDGCGAAVVLVVGSITFTAVLGRCDVVLCEASPDRRFTPVSLGGSQREITSQEERTRLRQAGVSIIGDGAMARLRHPSSGALSPVSRSLGDTLWKGAAPIIVCSPEVASSHMKGPDSQPFLLMLSSSITAVLDSQQLVELGRDFQMQPRAICGEISEKVLEASIGANPETQYACVGVSWMPDRSAEKEDKRNASEAPAKKPKMANAKSTSSVRLRHILVKWVDNLALSKQIDGKGRQVMRTRSDAEALLRKAIRELNIELRLAKKTPKDATELVMMQSKKFSDLCREMSDCPTAKKGGAMCGDLGWMMPEQLSSMGPGFKEKIDVLRPGQWSDITESKEGLHLIQKIA